VSDPAIKSAIRTTALVAFESIDKLNEKQLEALLVTLIEAGTDAEAEIAAKQLYHKQEARRLQLTLKAIIGGIGT
jgi:hypothetical protein